MAKSKSPTPKVKPVKAWAIYLSDESISNGKVHLEGIYWTRIDALRESKTYFKKVIVLPVLIAPLEPKRTKGGRDE